MSRVYRACLGTLQGFQVAKCSFFFFFFHFSPFWHFCKSIIIIIFWWPFWLDSHFKRFFHLMAISIVRKKTKHEGLMKRMICVKALQRKISWKSEVTTQGMQPPVGTSAWPIGVFQSKVIPFMGITLRRDPAVPCLMTGMKGAAQLSGISKWPVQTFPESLKQVFFPF